MRATGRNPAGDVVRGLRYGLDAASRIVEIADLRKNPSVDEDLTASFTYDDRYRLTSASYRTGKTNWQHDDVSKILSAKSDFGDPHLNVSNTYGESGAGPDALTHHGTEALSYDATGRITRDSERTYDWDAKGRLAKVVRGKTVEEYAYGHDDVRAIKVTTSDGKTEVTRYIDKDVEERNGKLIRYAFLGEQRLARLDPVDVGPRTAPVTKMGTVGVAGGNSEKNARPESLVFRFSRVVHRVLVPWGWIAIVGLALTRVLRASSRRRAWTLPRAAVRMASTSAWVCALSLVCLTIQACSGEANGHTLTFREQCVEITALPDTTEFYLADAQESPLAVVNKTASILGRIALHPFGHVRFQSGKQTDPWGFVGNEEDRGSGISDFHARPYRPELGVFLAVDPVALLNPDKLLEKPRAFAAYLYAISDPLNNVDADGLEPQKKGFWTRVGQGAIHLVAETLCMSLGGCGYANAPEPGDRMYPQASPAEVALNLTAAHVAPRVTALVASRILKVSPDSSVRNGKLVGSSPSISRFGENDLILGLNSAGELRRWTARHGGKTFGQFDTPKGTFDVQIRSAMDQAKRIRVNLDGIDISKANGRLSISGEPAGGYTNYEMQLLKTNSRYLQKTSFYKDGTEVKSPF